MQWCWARQRNVNTWRHHFFLFDFSAQTFYMQSQQATHPFVHRGWNNSRNIDALRRWEFSLIENRWQCAIVSLMRSWMRWIEANILKHSQLCAYREWKRKVNYELDKFGGIFEDFIFLVLYARRRTNMVGLAHSTLLNQQRIARKKWQATKKAEFICLRNNGWMTRTNNCSTSLNILIILKNG